MRRWLSLSVPSWPCWAGTRRGAEVCGDLIARDGGCECDCGENGSFDAGSGSDFHSHLLR